MRPGLNNKVRSHALTIAIIIALVVAVFISSMLLLAYYHRNHYTDFNGNNAVRYGMESAMNRVLADTSIYVQSLLVDSGGGVHTSMNKYVWGLFEVAHIQVRSGRFEKERTFFYGTSLPAFMDGCLYLADHQRALVLAGNTILTGNAFLPAAGLKDGIVEGRGYLSNKLIDGQVQESNRQLPPIVPPIWSQLSSLMIGGAANGPVAIQPGDTLIRSFAEPPLVIKQHGPVVLDQAVMKGHIIVQSDQRIEVGSHMQLEDVMLSAPVIHFRQRVTGTVQAFASDSMRVENGCNLHYPSALVIAREHAGMGRPVMALGEDCFFSGMLLSLCKTGNAERTFVTIKDRTQIEGAVYVNGQINLRGQVSGSVAADYFLHTTRMGEYENYLVDVRMSRNSLPGYFAIPSCFGSRTTKKIVQWVK